MKKSTIGDGISDILRTNFDRACGRQSPCELFQVRVGERGQESAPAHTHTHTHIDTRLAGDDNLSPLLTTRQVQVRRDALPFRRP
jgi:hypothetical protein